MPPRHAEQHFTAAAILRDIVIGMSDGLTVPFALAAGLAAAAAAPRFIVIAGLAEIAAGAVAMGLGGFLAARTEAEHYVSERARETHEVDHMSAREVREVEDILRGYGLEGGALAATVASVTADRERWIDFMMRFELGLEKPQAGRALAGALVVGLSYALGGLVPLAPYMVTRDLHTAFAASALAAAAALLAFGAVKGHFTGGHRLRAALQTLAVGGVAALAAFALARLAA